MKQPTASMRPWHRTTDHPFLRLLFLLNVKASMRPWHRTTDHAECARRNPGRAGFNEAVAQNHGSLLDWRSERDRRISFNEAVAQNHGSHERVRLGEGKMRSLQ